MSNPIAEILSSVTDNQLYALASTPINEDVIVALIQAELENRN